ncbi:urease subunit beta [Paracoccus nototheniae]|uniref:urease n=1 Tax=Paracoccus nototheniae TaxID=2489002 RepID=A0ABW4E3R1_9RHOB|nr:urease subunit beta [Paracoccus nototheniae]
MHLTPRETDRLLLFQAAQLARTRRERGLLLSEPEARALIADMICEGARAGGTVADMVTLASSALTEDDVMPGVGELISIIMVEALFPDGQKLICVHDPISPGRKMQSASLHQPRWRTGPDPIEINRNRPILRLRVVSLADRPIQIGSHYHFFEVNPALRFERQAAYGFRLDIPAATTLRFEPGDTRDVDLVTIGGARIVHGLAGLVEGPLDDPAVRERAMERLKDFLR